MAAKKTVRDPHSVPWAGKQQNISRALPMDATRVRNSGSPVGPEHPRTVPRGTGTKTTVVKP